MVLYMGALCRHDLYTRRYSIPIIESRRRQSCESSSCINTCWWMIESVIRSTLLCFNLPRIIIVTTSSGAARSAFFDVVMQHATDRAHSANDRNGTVTLWQWDGVLLGAQLLAGSYRNFSGRNRTCHPCALTTNHHHQLSPLAYKDINQPKRTNLIASPQLRVLSPIRLEEVWIIIYSW